MYERRKTRNVKKDEKVISSEQNAETTIHLTPDNTTEEANLNGSGSIASGENATAIGERGAAILGNVDDGIVTTGDENRINKINVGAQGTLIITSSPKELEERPTNRQAPPIPPLYVAREANEEKLFDLLLTENQGTNIVIVYGLPGVGKTFLATKVAQVLEEDFPDGTLWADLQSGTVAAILQSFIEPFLSTFEQGQLRNRAKYLDILQQHLADKKVLIILDQVESVEMVEQLIPVGCSKVSVLVVSRSRLLGLSERVQRISLGEMMLDEAISLLNKVWENFPRLESTSSTIKSEIAKQLNYIPASLAVVAQDILIHQIQPAIYLQNLQRQEQTQRLSDSPYLPGYEAVYNNLPTLARQLFPLVGALGGGFWTVSVLETISHLSRQNIESGLRQLLSSGLIDQATAGRFQAKPVVREFALSKLTEIGSEDLIHLARNSIANYYIHLASQLICHCRQLIIDDFLRDDNHEQSMIKHMNVVWSAEYNNSRLIDTKLVTIDSNLGSFDLFQDLFEEIVFAQPYYRQWWGKVLESSSLLDLSYQLEEALNWVYRYEDWSMIRRFARYPTKGLWLDAIVSGNKSSDGDAWIAIQFDFSLIRKVVIDNIYITNTELKAVRMVDVLWSECECLKLRWTGVHIYHSRFSNVDVVNGQLIGSVLAHCHFDHVTLRNSDLRGSIFYNCLFVNVDFRQANLNQTEFINCTFTSVDFRGTGFEFLSEENNRGQFSAKVNGRVIPGDLDMELLGAEDYTTLVMDLKPFVDSQLETLFQPLVDLAKQVAGGQEESVVQDVHSLRIEVIKGQEADDVQIAQTIEQLAALSPSMSATICEIFSKLNQSQKIGPVTAYVLKKLQDKLTKPVM